MEVSLEELSRTVGPKKATKGMIELSKSQRQLEAFMQYLTIRVTQGAQMADKIRRKFQDKTDTVEINKVAVFVAAENEKKAEKTPARQSGRGGRGSQAKRGRGGSNSNRGGKTQTAQSINNSSEGPKTDAASTPTNTTVTCFSCKGQGHIARDCPASKK